MKLWPRKLKLIRLTEHDRLLRECAFALGVKVNERDERIRLLTQTATAMEAERDEHIRLLTQTATAMNERDEHIRLLTQTATAMEAELKKQNELLTVRATEAVRKLQEIEQRDYQIIMAQQQLLAGMRDSDPRFNEIYEKCRPFTMTSVERLYALYKSVEYIVSANLEGDFAETGVWRGGSCMLIAETLLALGSSSRRIFLFDTFTGHPRPDAEKDVDIWGNRAVDEWQRITGEGKHAWGYVSLEEVQANLALTVIPQASSYSLREWSRRPSAIFHPWTSLRCSDWTRTGMTPRKLALNTYILAWSAPVFLSSTITGTTRASGWPWTHTSKRAGNPSCSTGSITAAGWA
jgi:Macrocin-O-methyltransferase (TylF)